MAIENVGPGGVSNSYGVRTASTEALANASIPKNVYNEFGQGLAVTATRDPATGVTTLEAGGETLSVGASLPSVFPDWVALSSTGAVCGSPCLIYRIRCITGSSVTLTVYDNAAASSGTVLFAGALSAGQEAEIDSPLQAINGVRAVFASGSFEFQIQQEAV